MNNDKQDIIAHFDQHELGLHEPTDGDITFNRVAARAVLVNDDGQIAIMNFSATGLYKLPGGGVDEGEEIESALNREIREETGYQITNVQPLGRTEEDRYFCNMHQTSWCFTAAVTNFVGTDLTPEESAAGMNLQWVDSYEDAIAKIKNASMVDGEGSQTGLEMMKMREVAILEKAQQLTNSSGAH